MSHAVEPSARRLEFRGLGTVEVWWAGQRLAVGGLKQRGLLALLMLEPGQVVSTTRLTERLWPDGGADRDTLYRLASRLRRALSAAGEDVLRAGSGGYMLAVDPRQVDLSQFERLRNHGRAELDAGRFESASDLLAESLLLWRGAALTGVAESVRQGPAARLQELRLLAIEERVTADMRLDRHEQLVPELRELVTEYPERQQLVAQLMTALHQCGRHVDALDVYNTTRRYMIDEFGLEPGDLLQHTQRQILADDPATHVAGSAEAATAGPGRETGVMRVVPKQLPADVDAFTGRQTALKALNELLGEAEDRAVGTVVVTAIGGTAGIGKTALAVHWARQIAHRFPDGQLYANLRGFASSGQAIEPAEALQAFLDALGVPPQRIPQGLDAQVGLYRSLLTGTQTLVLLDNARDAEQIRPLLPGSPGCLVIVTSRNQLPSLVAAEAAHPITLDVLSVAESRQLLAGRLGHDRIAAEPEAVDEIITRCARLPLALAIVAARSATYPAFPLVSLSTELGEAQGELNALDGGDEASNVRAVLSWSYRTLSPDAARLFRLLGSHPGPDVSTAAVASLVSATTYEARALLTELTCAHMLTEHAPGRYSFHDLLRAYATELAHTHDADADRRAALQRLLDHYLHTANIAAQLLEQPHRDIVALAEPSPGVTVDRLTDYEQAVAWFRAELPVLLAAIEHAARIGFDAHTWQLAWTLTDFLDLRGQWHVQVAIQQLALASAERLGSRRGQASAHRTLGRAHGRRGHDDEANTHLLKALDLYSELADRLGQAHTYRGLSLVSDRERQQQSNGSGLSNSRQALDLYRAVGDRAGEASALNAVGWDHTLLNDPQTGLTYCEQALALHQELGNRYGEGSTWDSLGYAHHQLGHHREAIACYRRALSLFRDLSDRLGEANTLTRLGTTELVTGQPDAARATWRAALSILDQLGHPNSTLVRSKLASNA